MTQYRKLYNNLISMESTSAQQIVLHMLTGHWTTDGPTVETIPTSFIVGPLMAQCPVQLKAFSMVGLCRASQDSTLTDFSCWPNTCLFSGQCLCKDIKEPSQLTRIRSISKQKPIESHSFILVTIMHILH